MSADIAVNVGLVRYQIMNAFGENKQESSVGYTKQSDNISIMKKMSKLVA
jgi:hypothetical protein